MTLTLQWHLETPSGLIMALVQNGTHREGKHVIKDSLYVGIIYLFNYLGASCNVALTRERVMGNETSFYGEWPVPTR